jgi:hypothetical protein
VQLLGCRRTSLPRRTSTFRGEYFLVTKTSRWSGQGSNSCVIQRENPIELTRARRRQIGKELVKIWDRKYPNWAYGDKKQPTSAFWDAYNNAESQVMYPSWTHPRKVSQMGKDESS